MGSKVLCHSGYGSNESLQGTSLNPVEPVRIIPQPGDRTFIQAGDEGNVGHGEARVLGHLCKGMRLRPVDHGSSPPSSPRVPVVATFTLARSSCAGQRPLRARKGIL